MSPARAGTEPLEYAPQGVDMGRYHFEVQLPKGLVFEIMTVALRRPRMLTFAPNGDLFIGSQANVVYRLAPPYRVPSVFTELQDYPHSIAFRGDEILVARTHGLFAAPYRPGQSRIDPGKFRRIVELPGGRGHNSRTVRVGPDGRIYISLGIASNCSDQYLNETYPPDDQRGGIVVLIEEANRTALRPFGSGLRNPVGFDWDPVKGLLYASNNGPDHLGFEQPPEYFSLVTEGSFHGMPWFQYDGKTLVRDPCIKRDPPRPGHSASIPTLTFPARSAPLGVSFVPPGALLPELAGDAIVALHGSWGTAPDGGPGGPAASRRHPKLVAVRFSNGTAVRVDDLATGFQLPSGQRWLRPAGAVVGADGALYFTSDGGLNGLFRLRRTEN